ncbi:hypothetical protein HDU76_007648, partial [Blyttiomyces sp. JEL0837]
GTIANGYVWGRGSVDCKAQLTAILEATETLLKNSFHPQRTIYFAFGFDEEISGRQGAGALATYLEKNLNLGNHGMELILDEGTGIEERFGSNFAFLATSEKGYMDVKFTVKTAGGHSSVPPDHTGIGYLASVITALEDHPFTYGLRESSPLMGELRCVGEFGKDMESELKSLIRKVDLLPGGSDEQKSAFKELAKELSVGKFKSSVYKALMSTTQAVDVVNGGVKVNALPEVASVIVNYRIESDASVKSVETRLVEVVKPVAERFGLKVVQKRAGSAEGEVVVKGGEEDVGVLEVDTLPDSLEPSPKTPVSGKPYQVVAGTIRHALQREGENLIVSPTSPTGNS